MLTTISGVYENGQITLDETPPVDKKAKVFVTFLEEVALPAVRKERVPGSLKGRINIPDDFNEPLEDLNEYMY